MTTNITELAAHMRGLASLLLDCEHMDSLSLGAMRDLSGEYQHATQASNVITILDSLEAAQAELEGAKQLAQLNGEIAVSLKIERDAALARLAELEKQEPVGMFFIGPVTGLYQPVHQDRPEQVKDYIPLYAAAGASPVQPSQAPELSDADVMRCIAASGCYGTVKMSYESGLYSVDTPSLNATKFARAIIAAINAKGS